MPLPVIKTIRDWLSRGNQTKKWGEDCDIAKNKMRTAQIKCREESQSAFDHYMSVIRNSKAGHEHIRGFPAEKRKKHVDELSNEITIAQQEYDRTIRELEKKQYSAEEEYRNLIFGGANATESS